MQQPECAKFLAKVNQHFTNPIIEARPIHLRDTESIVVGYTHLAPDSNVSSFMRFIVQQHLGRARIADPIMRCMDHALKFEPITADDDETALDQLADWFIANKELIAHSRPLWHAY